MADAQTTDKQISDLTSGVIGSDNDCFIFDDANSNTYKIPYSALASAILQTSISNGTGIQIVQNSESNIFQVILSLDMDNAPTDNSDNPVTSGGIYTALQRKQNSLTFDSFPTQESTNPVTSSGIRSYVNETVGTNITSLINNVINPQLATKQNNLTFDNTPTENSTNPVTSGGVYAALQGGGGSSVNSDPNVAINAVRESGAWGGTVTLQIEGHNYTFSSEQNLARFSHYWTGANASTYPYGFWQWICSITNTGIYYNLVNNDGNPDCIKVGDYFQSGECYIINQPFVVRIIGIDTYTGTCIPEIGHHIDWEIMNYVKVDDYLMYFNTVQYNNGCVPVATFTADGSTTVFDLSAQDAYMNGIQSVTLNGLEITSSDYSLSDDKDSVTFTTAPASGTLVITGWDAGKNPWVASRLYGVLNSIEMWAIPDANTANPRMTQQYSEWDSPYYYFEKNNPGDCLYITGAITPKYAMGEARYSSNGLATASSGMVYINAGKFWLPTLFELTGKQNYNNGEPTDTYSVHYPLYKMFSNQTKYKLNYDTGSTHIGVLTCTPANGNSTQMCVLNADGTISTQDANNTTILGLVCFRTGETFTIDPNWS